MAIPGVFRWWLYVPLICTPEFWGLLPSVAPCWLVLWWLDCFAWDVGWGWRGRGGSQQPGNHTRRVVSPLMPSGHFLEVSYKPHLSKTTTRCVLTGRVFFFFLMAERHRSQTVTRHYCCDSVCNVCLIKARCPSQNDDSSTTTILSTLSPQK